VTAPLFLVGFMAAGKTSVGRMLAARAGRRFIDLDDAIDLGGAASVAELVSRDEPEFRRREAAALARVIDGAHDAPIVATGGGAAAFGDNMDRMRAAGCVVALGVELRDAIRRAASGGPRPLMANAEELVRRRAAAYRRAHAVVDTTGKSIERVADDVEAVAKLHDAERDQTIVALGERSYAVVLADDFEPSASAAPGVVITDDNVARHHVVPTRATIAIAPGEAQKSFATYASLCEQLVARGVDRGGMIVGLGGGVVTDLAGFVAATLYRGVAWRALPTTIVGMCDAAIGGKTAIDLPAGKNLVGAFHQPTLVWCNLATLATLPERERRAGFGELWKYALLDGPATWQLVDRCASWAASGGERPPDLRDLLRRAIAYKAAIVGRDERERSGHRALLNLGHTVGHAIETATGLHHGECVGLGLVASARVSCALGLAPAELAGAIEAALRRSGLPADLDPYLGDDVLARLAVDKKRAGGTIGFIAIREVGECERVDVAVDELQRILRASRAP
jgi:shikimate kinase/3-dehydroquinate synthase